MKKIKKTTKLNKKKLIVCLIIFVIIISIIIIFTKKAPIKIFNKNKQEEFVRFEYEKIDFKLNDDYSYTFDGLVKVNELNGIETVTYTKNGEEITLNCNGKNKVAIDYQVHEDEEYTFKIKPINQSERTETLKVERKVAGKDTYKEIDGVYVNTPFLEDFNTKYTRYLSKTSNDTLKPENWINKEEPQNWYSYKDKNWANIYVECEGVEIYYVWIPRYMYKLDEETQRSDVKFVDVYNNYKNADTGEELTCNELIEQGYQLPEAFNFGDKNATAISGYWVSKYQLSESSQFKLDYNMATSPNSIVVSNFKNNMDNTAIKFTYAINGEIKNTKSQLDDYTFSELTEDETYTVNITALNENDEIVGSMTKTVEPTEVNPPDLSGFDPDTTFYVYWDENGIEHNEIPISRSAPNEWYNYTYSNWANIVTRNNGLEIYYVWIPRYQYALKQTSQRSNVKFIIGTGTETTNGYQIPDAFWFDKNDDGIAQDDEQLTGYWASKYQLSIEESNAKISAELAASGNSIIVKDITGTALKTKDNEGNEIDANLKYEYYLNGDLVHNGTAYNEHYTYSGLNINTTYVINIIARDANTNKYVGAITKKVITKVANDPDLSSFKSNNGLKEKTYYCIYDENGNNIIEYKSINQDAPSNWYDYSESKWANIVVTDGNINGNQINDATSTAYFTWVPRYEYSIASSLQDWSNRDTSNARTDVIFVNGRDNATHNGYIIPDAFWFDKNDDGEKQDDEQLTGYWITKYQLTD